MRIRLEISDTYYCEVEFDPMQDNLEEKIDEVVAGLKKVLVFEALHAEHIRQGILAA